jgi:ATP/maltotriose-dependent transcriptional regulator MalT
MLMAPDNTFPADVASWRVSAPDGSGDALLVRSGLSASERPLPDLGSLDEPLWLVIVAPQQDQELRAVAFVSLGRAELRALSPGDSVTAAGRSPDLLTDSETRVLRYLPTHLPAPEIAEKLCLSVHTVRTHMRHLYEKLAVHSRTQAVERARALGLLAPTSGHA